jgi:hypothetical protein
MPDAHSAVVGGSSAARVLACPGSIDLSAQAPAKPSSSFAEEGTALHSAMEWLLDTSVRRKRKPEQLLGLTFNKHVITEELLHDAVIPAYEYFQKVIGRHGHDYEQEITAPFPGIPGAFGTTDLSSFPEPHILKILDWKFGKGVPVSAKGNAQMRYYACCVIDRYKAWRKVKIIDMHICQPRIANGNSRDTISIDELRAFKHSLIRAVNGPRFLQPGDHCRWCGGAPFCEAKKKQAADALKWKAAGPELAEAMAMVPELEAWCASVKSAVHTALEQGAAVDGYKLVDKRATRKWAVDDPQVRAYLGQHGLTEDQFAPRSTVSPAQAEKLLKPQGEKLQGEMIKVESSGYTVAPDSDNRPAVSTGRDINALASFINK